MENQKWADRPVADASELAEFLIDRNMYEKLSNNGLIISYAVETGTRITPEVREKAIGLYHQWIAEEELNAERGLSLYFQKPEPFKFVGMTETGFAAYE